MFSTGHGDAGGINLRSLLCFIPGLYKRKSWRSAAPLRRLLKSLSDDHIKTIQLTRRNTQFYGSSDDEEEANSSVCASREFDVDEDDCCPPLYKLLPRREDSADLVAANGPEIIIHNPSSESNSVVSTTKSHQKHSLLSKDSAEDLKLDTVEKLESISSELSSTVYNESITCREDQQRQVDNYTCNISKTSSSYSITNSASYCESCSTCNSKCEDLECQECLSGDGYPVEEPISESREKEQCIDGVISNSVIISDDCQSVPNGAPIFATSKSTTAEASCTENPLFQTSTPKHVNSDAKLPDGLISIHADKGISASVLGHQHVIEADNLSSSTDSRLFSYVSAPRRPAQFTPTKQEGDNFGHVTDLTLSSTECETNATVAALISEDLAQEANQADLQELPPEVKNENTSFGEFVMSLFWKSSPKRQNPFNSPDCTPLEKVSVVAML